MNKDVMPSEQLLDAVEEIATAMQTATHEDRSLIAWHGLAIHGTVLPKGATEFFVSGIVDYLIFLREPDGSRHIKKYVKADWEGEVYKILSACRKLRVNAEATEYWGPELTLRHEPLKQADVSSSGIQVTKALSPKEPSRAKPTGGGSIKHEKSVGLRILLAIAGIGCGLVVQVIGSILLKLTGLEVLEFVPVILGFIVMGYCVYRWAFK